MDCGRGAILEFLEDDASGFGVFDSQFSGSIGNGFAIFDYSLDELFSSLHKMGITWMETLICLRFFV